MDPKPPETIDEYIAQYPPEVQDILKKIRSVVHAAAPGAQETIKYRMPTFLLDGNLVYFAAFQNHIGFYPIPTGIDQFKEELSAYHTAKGSVQFPYDRPMPYDLIARIVAFRVEENRQKAARKKKK